MLQRNLGERAFDSSFVATRREGASIRQVKKIWNHAFDGIETVFLDGIVNAAARARHRAKQHLSVWMLRIVEHVHRGADLDNFPRVHDGNSLRHFSDHTKIM